ncbi:MAG: DNA repair protein RecN, partial [Paludibacteraceae bacterium]|nr:DNA repair protein RecN [Paludibacteraceae bacterium]
LESERKEAEEKAAALTARRKEGAVSAEQETVNLLKELGMENVRFQATITPKADLEKDGADDISFMF